MSEEYKIKSALLRTLIALILCMGMVVMKFILKDENFMEEVYNYIASDIVFLK